MPASQEARDSAGIRPVPTPISHLSNMHTHTHRYKHGNDSFFYRAVEPDSLIAVLWHFSRFDN